LSDQGKEYKFPMSIAGKSIGYPFGGLVAHLWDIYIEDQGKISLLITAIVNGVLLIGLVVVVLWYLKPCRKDVVPMGLLWN
jgi:F0F1-type ATP synthase membrane subunit c/vacuolar-type H+-ATPase subunit K